MYLQIFSEYQPASTKRRSKDSARATTAGSASGARRMSRPRGRSCHAASTTITVKNYNEYFNYSLLVLDFLNYYKNLEILQVSITKELQLIY